MERPKLIRTKRRSLRYPRGRPLLCAYGPCLRRAIAGFEITDRFGMAWPFCSETHRNASWIELERRLEG